MVVIRRLRVIFEANFLQKNIGRIKLIGWSMDQLNFFKNKLNISWVKKKMDHIPRGWSFGYYSWKRNLSNNEMKTWTNRTCVVLHSWDMERHGDNTLKEWCSDTLCFNKWGICYIRWLCFVKHVLKGAFSMATKKGWFGAKKSSAGPDSPSGVQIPESGTLQGDRRWCSKCIAHTKVEEHALKQKIRLCCLLRYCIKHFDAIGLKMINYPNLAKWTHSSNHRTRKDAQNPPNDSLLFTTRACGSWQNPPNDPLDVVLG